jgi:site-specific DNA-methyltransferase (adenine-specific)
MSTWTVHNGDTLRLLSAIETGSVDLVLTDPPYNSGGRTTAERTTQTSRDKYVSGDAAHHLADFPGDNRDQRAFTLWLSHILAEALRASRVGASCLVFTDYRQLPATSDALQIAGWTWRGVIPWRKPIARPTPNGFKRECEYILWGSYGQPFHHVPPIYLPGFVQGSQPRGKNRVHITQKPVEGVLDELVKVCPEGGTVLDPFTGSGSTGIAAVQSGRRFVGVELTEHYADVARQRIDEADKAARQVPPTDQP